MVAVAGLCVVGVGVAAVVCCGGFPLGCDSGSYSCGKHVVVVVDFVVADVSVQW